MKYIAACCAHAPAALKFASPLALCEHTLKCGYVQLLKFWVSRKLGITCFSRHRAANAADALLALAVQRVNLYLLLAEVCPHIILRPIYDRVANAFALQLA